MANEVDQDRLNDTTKGAVVIDLNQYKANAGAPSVAQPMLTDALRVPLFWLIIGACILLAFFTRK